LTQTNDGFAVSGPVQSATNQKYENLPRLQTKTLVDGSIDFSDPTWTNYPNRFYRISTP
jgi:hypothetical protein